MNKKTCSNRTFMELKSNLQAINLESFFMF